MSTSRIIHSYTDGHDVDEGMMANSEQGGCWNSGKWTGVVNRDLFDSSLFLEESNVASSNMKN